jgi:hypothetical protein
MDIETVILPDNTMIPYLISWFDGSISKSYYLTDFNSSDDMLSTAIKALMKVKYNSYKIYLHNFANFDGIFVVKILNKLGIINPIINKGKIISISLGYGKKYSNRSYNIIFRDSLQILLASLRKLALCFNVDTQKNIFPHRFVTEQNLNYIGPVPSYDFFDNITLDDYKEYCTNFHENNWNLREEAIKYCKADCISLY